MIMIIIMIMKIWLRLSPQVSTLLWRFLPGIWRTKLQNFPFLPTFRFYRFGRNARISGVCQAFFFVFTPLLSHNTQLQPLFETPGLTRQATNHAKDDVREEQTRYDYGNDYNLLKN